jgi:SAM-dependent methyltransferase
LGTDGIYSAALPAASDQTDEIQEREVIARREYPDLLVEVGRHHSMPVMEREVRSFLDGIAANGVVADIGGGWGWHWRHLGVQRGDVCVIVVDLVRENLRRAAHILGPLINDRVFLVHGDATRLPFPPGIFDGYWSVQTLQHIPSFEQAVAEAHRVLRRHGVFACYSLNRATLIEAVYRVMGRPYHLEGKRPGSFYLGRGSVEQSRIVSRVFGSRVVNRYTEVLFHPDLELHTGGMGSPIGRLDACLSSSFPLLASVARQRSYHTRKLL